MTLHAKSIIMESNGREGRRGINDKIIAVAVALSTSLIAGCFAFLWNLNANIVRLQDQVLESNKTIDEINIKINNIQLDIRDLREKVIRIESANQKLKQ